MVYPAEHDVTFDNPVGERRPSMWTRVRQRKELISHAEYADHRVRNSEHAAFTLWNLINAADGLERGGIIFFHAGILT